MSFTYSLEAGKYTKCEDCNSEDTTETVTKYYADVERPVLGNEEDLIKYYNENKVNASTLVETIDGTEVEISCGFHDSLITKFDPAFRDCWRCDRTKEELEVIMYHDEWDFICLKCFEEVTRKDISENI